VVAGDRKGTVLQRSMRIQMAVSVAWQFQVDKLFFLTRPSNGVWGKEKVIDSPTITIEQHVKTLIEQGIADGNAAPSWKQAMEALRSGVERSGDPQPRWGGWRDRRILTGRAKLEPGLWRESGVAQQ